MRFLFDLGKYVLFPEVCVQCSEILKGRDYLICPSCREDLVLVDRAERCPRCFSIDRCFCDQMPCLLKQVAGAFDNMGPGGLLVHSFREGGRSFLAQDLAAFMVQQLIELGWPFPDLIVPVPHTAIRSFMRGYRPSTLLAKEVGKFLERPVKNLLKKLSGCFPQTGLNLEQRESLCPELFMWKHQENISDQKILLIDDMAVTRASLCCAAKRLGEGFPQQIYGLVASI